MERDTRQRRAIRDALEAAGRPLGPQEVLEAATAAVPALSLATVYRTLRALADEGRIVAVELPGEPPRYEVAGLGHHHHFRCQSCCRVFEVACGGDHGRLASPPGFRLERQEIVLYGLCPACAGG